MKGDNNIMKKSESNQTIKCEVESCKYNNEEGICDLEEIQVGCNCDNDKCECTDETICQSFKEDKKKIKEAGFEEED